MLTRADRPATPRQREGRKRGGPPPVRILAAVHGPVAQYDERRDRIGSTRGNAPRSASPSAVCPSDRLRRAIAPKRFAPAREGAERRVEGRHGTSYRPSSRRDRGAPPIRRLAPGSAHRGHRAPPCFRNGPPGRGAGSAPCTRSDTGRPEPATRRAGRVRRRRVQQEGAAARRHHGIARAYAQTAALIATRISTSARHDGVSSKRRLMRLGVPRATERVRERNADQGATFRGRATIEGAVGRTVRNAPRGGQAEFGFLAPGPAPRSAPAAGVAWPVLAKDWRPSRVSRPSFRSRT